ncbi:hypothetical protein MAA8898_03566 [Maliponia aquimaris]|uniref:DUF6455 domain-containing protein n=2 Tax=Maliponia aquimaris TaxID=1673631 RepID=A0A238KVZ4_9RHOB|nr:hypothetical protein MAA8898_03566 [Maliponia aquimaris]
MGDETRHFWLVQRMAKATGVDLVAAMQDGDMTQQDWAGIVTDCRGCQWVEGCTDWLDTPVDDTRPAPESCVNRERLAHLQSKLDELAQQEG